MLQDATCYGGRPHPRRLCILDGDPALLPKKGWSSPNFRPTSIVAKGLHESIGTEVGLGLRDIVLDGDPAPLPQRGTAPNFRPMSVVAKRLDGLRCRLVWR